MLSLGALGFAQPWLLAALAALPALYLLLRLTPPAPQKIAFPPVAILRRLQTPEETPARTPWWLLLLRMLVAALVILALARPILNPAPEIPGSGPVVLILDNDWAGAANWDERITLGSDLLEQAERANRQVVVLTTAAELDPQPVSLMQAGDARERLLSLEPLPWPADRANALKALGRLDLEDASAIWLSNGLRQDEAGLAGHLSGMDDFLLVTPSAQGQAYLLRPPRPQDDGLGLAIERTLAEADARTVAIEAIGPEGEIFGRSEIALGPDALGATALMALPADIQNRIAKLVMTGQDSAAATILFDERWRRRTVGIATAAGTDNAQPLLAEDYYIERALRPFAELRKQEIADLLKEPLSLLILTDRGVLEPELRADVENWIEDGGVLLRFAGPKLATAQDPLVPVPLRQGDRTLGGALSWSTPLTLQPFDPTGIFAGLFVSDEITISRQVLAQPGPGVSDATLVTLEDGTPLVTGVRRGQGWLILVHTSANTTWTNLPLSGLFVDMLKRMSELGLGTQAANSDDLILDQMLDAFGRLGPAPGHMPPLGEGGISAAVASPQTPPGLYGDPDRADGDAGGARQALNIQGAIDELEPLRAAGLASQTAGYGHSAETDLLPWLLTSALLLAMVDMVIGLAFRGLIPRLRPAAAAVLLSFVSISALAADDAATAALTAETRLAFARTGIPAIDQMSEAGLLGLGEILGRRTSIETGAPVGITPGVTDLDLFPLIYWPMPPEHPELSEGALEQINGYLRQGGLILFDTGDAARLLPGQQGGGPGQRRLRQLLGQLDIPPLREVPIDHTLTRSFYLLTDFPGRFTGQPLWVDSTPAGINDGVAGVVIGAHDWASAWATDEYGTPLRPVVPGGERQREMARRFGVNLVMYALTGNYKTDQVHVPALLERLGQ